MKMSESISEDLKKAMKSRNQLEVSCLRMLITAIKNKRVEKGDELDNNEIQALISSQIRKGQTNQRPVGNSKHWKKAEARRYASLAARTSEVFMRLS